MPTPNIFISAGEASGERYGAMLIEAIRRRIPEATFFGLGGKTMESAGCERIVRAEDIAVMGITEVIRHMPKIYRRYRELVRSIRIRNPDIAVLIDFPDVNFRLARELKKLGIPVVYFVSPQLWAWKKHRVRWVRERITKMLVIFPFEESFYREHGVDAEFVGHPLGDVPMPSITREEFAQHHRLDPAKEWIGLLPGSRLKELRLNLPGMLAAAKAWGAAYEYVLPIAVTLDAEMVKKVVAENAARYAPGTILHVVPDARAALKFARASIVASGTATVEAALIGSPFIVIYRLSALSYAVASRLVKLPHVAMVNLIAGKRIVPELIQKEFTPANVLRELLPLLADGPARATMMDELAAVRNKLHVSDRDSQQLTAVDRAADWIVRYVVPQNSAASAGAFKADAGANAGTNAKANP